MSKKHFIALAKALRAVCPPKTQQIALSQWRVDVSGVADVCAVHNPNFNRAKFYDACGWSE